MTWAEILEVSLEEVPWQVVLISDRPLTEAEYNHPLAWNDNRRRYLDDHA